MQIPLYILLIFLYFLAGAFLMTNEKDDKMRNEK